MCSYCSALIEQNQTAAAGRAGNLTAQKKMDVCRRNEFLVYYPTSRLKGPKEKSVRGENGENKDGGAHSCERETM